MVLPKLSSSIERVSQSTQPEMARLLEQSPSFKELRRGDLVAGEVMRVGQDGLLVNIGHRHAFSHQLIVLIMEILGHSLNSVVIEMILQQEPDQ